MKRLLTTLTAIALLAAACSPGVTPASTSAAPVPDATPTHIRVDLSPAQRAALQRLAESLELTADQITLVSTEAVDWPDGCLGVAQPGMMCTQVITPGFRIVLTVNSRDYEYRTNQDGTLVRPASPALAWSRMGGIAGFCDDLTVYASGEVRASTCNGAGAEGGLIRAELIQLNDWLAKFGAVQIKFSDGGVADSMSLTLMLTGHGSAQPSAEERQALLTWAQAVYARVKSSAE